MQFNIDGRFSAEVRWEHGAWTVRPASPPTHPARPAAVASAGLAEDDIASFLDDLFLEADRQGHDVEHMVAKLAGR